MKNRAKCKLCKTIIESFHATDYVQCNCGEIAVDGADALLCFAKNFDNFLRIDDQGNEIVVTLKEKSNILTISSTDKPTRKELLDMLQTMLQNIESLPAQAMSSPINHYDFVSVMLLVSSILRSDCKDLS